MRLHPFGKRIEPRCKYCANGRPSIDGVNILCPRRGVVTPDAKCRRFVYDPLLRVPQTAPTLPTFSEDDFSLEGDDGIVL